MEPTPIRSHWPHWPRGPLAFVLGAGIGAIPLVIWLAVVGTAFARSTNETFGTLPDLNVLLTGLAFSLALYVVMWIVAFALLGNERRHTAGQGVVAALLASPVIGYLGCAVIPNLAR